MTVRIGITGSWRERDRVSWALRESAESFKAACCQVGVALGRTGATSIVGSDSDSTADKYAVEGYLSSSVETPFVRVIRPADGKIPFASLYRRYPSAFTYLTSASPSWRHTRQMLVRDIDTLIMLGGADGSYQAGLELSLTKKRLVPVGSFGGAGSRLLGEIIRSPRLSLVELYEKLNNPWDSGLASTVVELVGANRPSRVLVIHGHAEDRTQLQLWLKQESLAEPVLMDQEFTAGQTLPEKFEYLAENVDAAIAVATPDDLGAVAKAPASVQPRARQNVWVEVGWFWGRLGRHRVLLLVRGDLEVPSDLDGIELHRYENSVTKTFNVVSRFLKSLSVRNQ